MEIKANLGKNLRFYREKSELSQGELASRCAEIRESALSQRAYVSDVENGKRNVSVEMIETLASALCIDPCQLLGGSETGENGAPPAMSTKEATMKSREHSIAKAVLEDTFTLVAVDEGFLDPQVKYLKEKYQNDLKSVFYSKTQSYREALLGCAVIHVIVPDVDIRLPYAKNGDRAFNGRSLDEKVINVFLVSHQIPCSRGPYLATFRRGVQFDASTRAGLRDQVGYDAMLRLIAAIEASSGDEAKAILACLLRCFYELRERSNVRLAKVERLSSEQYRCFLELFLRNASGGRIPMLVATAIFHAINEYYKCEYCSWKIDSQGVNAADKATGTPGDITIWADGKILKAVEVTERTIDEARVVATFNSKITTSEVKSYLFVYTSTPPTKEAYGAAKVYFAQGYDIEFVNLLDFVITHFVSGGAELRGAFTNHMLTQLNEVGIPSAVKTAWNDALYDTIHT